MTPFEWAALISAIIGTFSAANPPENTQDTKTAPEATGGPDPASLTGGIGETLAGAPPGAPPLPDLAGPTQAAKLAGLDTAQAAKAAVPAPLDPAIPTPEGAPADPQANSTLATLQAIPQALAGVQSLLGTDSVNTVTQRPAPVAGGGGGGQPVGQFAQSFGQGAGGLNIGQLLAALPGIR